MKKALIRFIQKRILHRAQNILHPKKYISINDAHQVAFVFNTNDEGVSDAVTFLRNELKKRNIKYRAVAIDLKESSEGVPMYQYDPNVINFYITDFNWYGLPIHQMASEFTKEPFDFIIDLSRDSLFSINYLVECSAASYKIGSRSSSDISYDLVIETPKDHPFNLLTYAQQTIEYLSVIKTN